MSVYRFLGTECLIGNHRKLQRFGESIDLPDELAHELIVGAGSEQGFAGSSPLLPDAEFQEVFGGVTEKELAHFSIPANQFGDAAADFRERRQKALEALHSYRLDIETGKLTKENVHA